MKTIALDFDNTYTTDPKFWMNFIVNSPFDVVIVTARDERHDKCHELGVLELYTDVYYTAGVAKHWWMKQFAPKHHKNIDIWIDDKPEAIFKNSEATPEWLEEWRKTREY